MRKISTLLALLLVATQAGAVDVPLSWTPKPGATGYTVLWGSAPSIYTDSMQTASNSASIALSPGKTYVAVQPSGTLPRSNEMVVDVVTTAAVGPVWGLVGLANAPGNPATINYAEIDDIAPKLWRLAASWENVELARGTYNFAATGVRAAMDYALAHGVSVTYGIWYGNPLYPPVTSPNNAQAEIGRVAMAKYAAEVARLFGRAAGGPVDRIETWNEWVGGMGMGGFAQCQLQPNTPCENAVLYAKMQCAIYAAVKAVDPAVKVLGGGFAGFLGAKKLIGPWLDAGVGNCMDELVVHAYPGGPRALCSAAESADPVLSAACTKRSTYLIDSLVRAKIGRSIPISITETGRHDGDLIANEAAVATYATALHDLMVTDPLVTGIYWYALHSRGTTGWAAMAGTRKKAVYPILKAIYAAPGPGATTTISYDPGPTFILP